MLNLLWMNPHLERPSQKSLFPEELQIHETKNQRREPTCKKHGLPWIKIFPKTAQQFSKKPSKIRHHSAGEGGGHQQQAQGLVLLKCRRRGICLQHPAAAAQHCIAGEGPCSKAGACSQLIFLQIQSCQRG